MYGMLNGGESFIYLYLSICKYVDLLNQKDPTGVDSAEGAHGRPPYLVLLL